MHAIFVLVFVIVIIAVIYAFHAAAERRKRLCAWAFGRGLSFSPAKDRGFDEFYSDFKCLNAGHSRYAKNIMQGHWGALPIACFDYHYTTGSGKNQQHHSLSAVVIDAPLPLKPLFIRREGFFDKIGGFFGFDDIDFESAEFSRRFFVKSSDRKWAYDVIHTRMMEYLLANGRYTIQFDHARIIVEDSKCWEGAQFEAAASFIQGMLDLLPEYLVNQQTGQ